MTKSILSTLMLIAATLASAASAEINISEEAFRGAVSLPESAPAETHLAETQISPSADRFAEIAFRLFDPSQVNIARPDDASVPAAEGQQSPCRASDRTDQERRDCSASDVIFSF
jgi:hypothetical protein